MSMDHHDAIALKLAECSLALASTSEKIADIARRVQRRTNSTPRKPITPAPISTQALRPHLVRRAG